MANVKTLITSQIETEYEDLMLDLWTSDFNKSVGYFTDESELLKDRLKILTKLKYIEYIVRNAGCRFVKFENGYAIEERKNND